MVTQTDLELRDGRTLHVYDTLADGADAGLTVFWHHGTPNLGPPPEPLFPAAARRGIRWVSYDRPGYGGSTPHPGRDLASAAADVTSVADALGIGRFAAMGHSGGSISALACGALLPERVLGLVCVAALAPFHAKGLDWFAGMAAAGAAELRAATGGRAALVERLTSNDFDPEQFTPADHAAIAGPWSWLGGVAGQAPGGRSGRDGGRRPGLCRPMGVRSRAGPRAGAVAARWPGSGRAQLPRQVARDPDPLGGTVVAPGCGHISVLNSAEAALDWLWEHT